MLCQQIFCRDILYFTLLISNHDILIVKRFFY